MELRAAEHPHPRHTLAHISDTHFPAEGLLHGVADTRERLSTLLHDLEASGVHPEALVFSGDLADSGEERAYWRLREVVEPMAARTGATVVWAMGNHDRREVLRATLLDEPSSARPYDHTLWLGGLRLVVLDSTVPQKSYGELRLAQLEWLREQLDEPAPEGTVLVMHHPPVPCVQDLAVTVELRDQARLAEVVAGTDVRLILAGHLHYPSNATFAGIPVSVASATCYTQDLQMPGRGTRGQDLAQGFNLVHVYENTIVNSVVSIDRGPSVTESFDAQRSAELIAAAGMYIPQDEPWLAARA